MNELEHVGDWKIVLELLSVMLVLAIITKTVLVCSTWYDVMIKERMDKRKKYKVFISLFFKRSVQVIIHICFQTCLYFIY